MVRLFGLIREAGCLSNFDVNIMVRGFLFQLGYSVKSVRRGACYAFFEL